jgi:hypothetical protein
MLDKNFLVSQHSMELVQSLIVFVLWMMATMTTTTNDDGNGLI